jgi:hypothetical protein
MKSQISTNMTNELKIVVKETGVITVFVNDKPIGCIQELKLQADVHSALPLIELTFPSDPDMDGGLRDGIGRSIADLEKLSFVRVIKNPIKRELHELGTIGVIDRL